MSLAVCLPLAVASAVGYGLAAAVQHDALTDESGARLATLVRNPRWWMSIGGDTVGLCLQLAALATGPVVFVQPLFVLCLPVALAARARIGGPRPVARDYAWSAVLGVALGLFFVLAGTPKDGHDVTTSTVLMMSLIAFAAGALPVLATRGSANTTRAVVISAAAGTWFGVEAVLVNIVSNIWRAQGLAGFGHPGGLVPLISVIVLGLLGFALSQYAFRFGSIAVSFPAMLVVDPLVAVTLGALVLGEDVRSGPAAIAGYVLCAVLIILATLRLVSPLEQSETVRDAVNQLG